MKKLLLVILSTLFLSCSLFANEQKIRKQCIIDNLVIVDNEKASKIIDHACWYGFASPAAEDEDKKWANCIFENMPKVSEKNFKAAILIEEACRFKNFLSFKDDENWSITWPNCILKNIEKAKSKESAKNLDYACRSF